MINLNKENNQKVERLCEIINECETKADSMREEAVDLLHEASKLYNHIQLENGINYFHKNFPEVPQRFGILVGKLMEYRS